jgi:hypothetical protein
MIIVSNKTGRLFDGDGGGASGAGDAPAQDGLPPYSIDDLFADPQVCRRVGRIISEGARARGAQGCRAPRASRAGGSADPKG